MTKLSDTQAVILSAASQRDDGAVLPLPETLRIKGGAVDKVLGSLKAKGLIEHQGTPRGDDLAPLRITRTGLQAIGVEPEDTGDPDAQEAGTAGQEPQAQPEPAEAAKAPAAAKGKPKKARSGKAAKSTKAAPADKHTPRAGTKQAKLIELLKRPEGATVEQIAEATGWQKHTIRGAISGAL